MYRLSTPTEAPFPSHLVAATTQSRASAPRSSVSLRCSPERPQDRHAAGRRSVRGDDAVVAAEALSSARPPHSKSTRPAGGSPRISQRSMLAADGSARSACPPSQSPSPVILAHRQLVELGERLGLGRDVSDTDIGFAAPIAARASSAVSYAHSIGSAVIAAMPASGSTGGSMSHEPRRGQADGGKGPAVTAPHEWPTRRSSSPEIRSASTSASSSRAVSWTASDQTTIRFGRGRACRERGHGSPRRPEPGRHATSRVTTT